MTPLQQSGRAEAASYHGTTHGGGCVDGNHRDPTRTQQSCRCMLRAADSPLESLVVVLVFRSSDVRSPHKVRTEFLWTRSLVTRWSRAPGAISRPRKCRVLSCERLHCGVIGVTCISPGTLICLSPKSRSTLRLLQCPVPRQVHGRRWGRGARIYKKEGNPTQSPR